MSKISGLERAVADTYALIAQLHICHWNVEGPEFFDLHCAFGEMYDELFAAVDCIAEQLRQLGYKAPGGLRMLLQLTPVEEIRKEETNGREMVMHLLAQNEKVLNNLHATQEICSAEGDVASEDVMIGRIKAHSKMAWKLRSYLK